MKIKLWERIATMLKVLQKNVGRTYGKSYGSFGLWEWKWNKDQCKKEHHCSGKTNAWTTIGDAAGGAQMHIRPASIVDPWTRLPLAHMQPGHPGARCMRWSEVQWWPGDATLPRDYGGFIIAECDQNKRQGSHLHDSHSGEVDLQGRVQSTQVRGSPDKLSTWEVQNQSVGVWCVCIAKSSGEEFLQHPEIVVCLVEWRMDWNASEKNNIGSRPQGRYNPQAQCIHFFPKIYHGLAPTGRRSCACSTVTKALVCWSRQQDIGMHVNFREYFSHFF